MGSPNCTLVKLAVISDLHLGSDDRTDSFEHDDHEFLRFLSFLEGNFERIVLLGDIWETLTSRCPWSARKALATARLRHPEIDKRLRRDQYLYIHGNHDMISAVVDGAPDHWQLEVDGKRFLFTHGHGHDSWIGGARRPVELAICLGGWLRRAGLHSLYHWLDTLDQTRSAISEDPLRCTFQAWAMSLANRRNTDVIITGHTHMALAKQHGPRLFLNSGSCSQGKYSYLGLDTTRDEYGVHTSW